jgi:hypothetical protein
MATGGGGGIAANALSILWGPYNNLKGGKGSWPCGMDGAHPFAHRIVGEPDEELNNSHPSPTISLLL